MQINITPLTNLIMREEVFFVIMGALAFVFVINQLPTINLILNSVLKGIRSFFLDFSKSVLVKSSEDNTYKLDEYSSKKNNKLMFSIIALQLLIVGTAGLIYDNNKYGDSCQATGYDYYIAGKCLNIIDVK